MSRYFISKAHRKLRSALSSAIEYSNWTGFFAKLFLLIFFFQKKILSFKFNLSLTIKTINVGIFTVYLKKITRIEWTNSGFDNSVLYSQRNLTHRTRAAYIAAFIAATTTTNIQWQRQYELRLPKKTKITKCTLLAACGFSLEIILRWSLIRIIWAKRNLWTQWIQEVR